MSKRVVSKEKNSDTRHSFAYYYRKYANIHAKNDK